MKKICFVPIMMALAAVCCVLGSCEKFLEAKSDQRLVIPSTVGDLQALFENYPRVNQFGPGALETSADDYYVTTADFQSLPEYDRRQYTWEKDNLFQASGNDWSNLYDNVYRANTVLFFHPSVRVEAGEEPAWRNVRGHALFLRAHCFLKAALIWAPVYDEATAASDLGIPLRLDPDFNKPSVRASVKETYDQILQDLKEAVPLLPVVAAHPMRPSKPAAYALLARTFLAMRRYGEAGRYADSCLQLKSDLLDYNTVNASAPFPFERFNREVLYDSHNGNGSAIHPLYGRIDSNLYASYSANDIRKTAFFKAAGSGRYSFKGSYIGYEVAFDGIALPEVWLMRAECRAREGRVSEAMSDLNALLVRRWKTGTFTPMTAATVGEALGKILAERRKEQVMRFLRWMDLKRLNKEGAGITLKRVVNNQVYTLPPNDLRYALAIPEKVIELSGMPQNPR